MGSTEESLYRSARVLAAFMTPQEAAGFAESFAIDKATFLQGWQVRALTRNTLTPQSYVAPRVEDVPSAGAAHIAAIQGHGIFMNPDLRERLYPRSEFRMIELGRLIAFQHWMDTDVSDRVHGDGSGDTPDLARMLDKCLPVDVIPKAHMVWHQNASGVSVYSMNNALGVIGGGIDKNNNTVTFAVGAAPNLMLVREHGGRYVLVNGYHRAWWLRSRGVVMAPVIVAHPDTKNDLSQPGAIHLDVLTGDRPPLVDDFLDETLSLTTQVRSMLKAVKISAEVTLIPRIL
jgi:hypothetical protein